MAEPRFAMEEIHGWSLVEVAGWHRSLAAIESAIARACGIAAPADVGGVAVMGAVSLIRVGPGRIWLVDEAGEITARLQGALDAAQGCATPLGEGRRRFRLSGQRVLKALPSLVALDPAAPAFAPGRAALTMMHRVPVLLHRLTDTTVDVYVPRSFSQSLEEWVRDAAA